MKFLPYLFILFWGQPSQVVTYGNQHTTVVIKVWYDRDISSARISGDPSIETLNPHQLYTLDDQNYIQIFIDGELLAEGYATWSEIEAYKRSIRKWINSPKLEQHSAKRKKFF